jgi:hypothetical protein
MLGSFLLATKRHISHKKELLNIFDHLCLMCLFVAKHTGDVNVNPRSFTTSLLSNYREI